ncbi:MAG: cytochrome c maturation protein CcmE [Alphaproteobacteria bacterium]|nr:cytochrome c maturation protein CcmE [Alphaproteobacteria bacterium]
MKRKHKRLWIVISALAGLAAVVALVLVAFEDSIVFFYSPSDIVEKEPPPGRRLRLGGLVEEKSVTRGADGVTISFRVTDTENTVPVSFRGMLPDLFREGQGVVAEGRLDESGVLIASQVLAKHDENYMPAEVAEALKEAGQWKGASQ